LNSIVENAPLGHGVAQDFGAEAREGLYKCSECEHWNRNPVSGITKCKKCGNGKFVKAAEGDFGMVGEGNNFGQNRAEGFNAETLNAEGGQFRTGAMYGAGAVVGITGATLALGAIFSLIGRRS